MVTRKIEMAATSGSNQGPPLAGSCIKLQVIDPPHPCFYLDPKKENRKRARNAATDDSSKQQTNGLVGKRTPCDVCPPPRVLAALMRAHIHKSTEGKPYYYEEATKKTSWSRPIHTVVHKATGEDYAHVVARTGGQVRVCEPVHLRACAVFVSACLSI